MEIKRIMPPSTAQKERKMSSCKRSTGARLRPRTKAGAATKTNPFNVCPGIICSCGKMSKDSKGLKLSISIMSIKSFLFLLSSSQILNWLGLIKCISRAWSDLLINTPIDNCNIEEYPVNKELSAIPLKLPIKISLSRY